MMRMVEVAGVEPASNAFMPSEYYERSWLRSQHQMRPLLRPGSDRRRHHRYRRHVDSCGTYRGFFCRVSGLPRPVTLLPGEEQRGWTARERCRWRL